MTRKLFVFLMLLFFVSGCAGLQSINQPEKPVVMSSDKLMDMLAGSEVNKVRAFTTHIGGGVGALDKIATANLSNGDISFVITGGKEYVYVFDSTGSDAEDTTDYRFIRPDDFGAAGVWDLLSRSAIGYTMAPSTDPAWEFMDSESPGADKSTAWIKAIYVDGGDGAENGDIIIEVIKGGAENTEVLRYDETDDRWETTQGLQMNGALSLEGAINLGTGGVVITDDGDGALTILGAGDGFNENLILNFDDTENTVGVTSGTSVALVDFGTINLATDNLDLSEGPITNVSDIAVNSISDNDNDGFTIASAGSTVTVESVVFTGGALTGVTSITASGVITGLINTSVDVGAVTNFNGTFAVSSASSIAFTLPTAVAGYSICLYQGVGRTDALSVTAASGDYIVLNGVAGTTEAGGAESELHSGAAATDRICVVSVNSDAWYVSSSVGTWTE